MTSPWAPEAAGGGPPDRDDAATGEEPAPGSPGEGSAGDAGDAPEPPGRGDAPDAVVGLGLAVVALAAAGLCLLLGEQLLLGVLRIAAAVLAGLGLGAFALTVLAPRLRRRRARALAALLATAAAVALLLPGVLTTRLPASGTLGPVSVAALSAEDQVVATGVAGAPVLLRRADGSAELIGDEGAAELPLGTGEAAALSADGALVLITDGERTRVLVPAADGTTRELAELPGTVLSAGPEGLVVHRCTAAADGGGCVLEGFVREDLDPDASTEPRWTQGAGTLDQEQRGPSPAGTLLGPTEDEGADGPGAAARASGLVPALPVRFDPAQGWVQLDPATGFPVGRILAGPEEDCRVAVTAADPGTEQAVLAADPVVLLACAGEDGALTASAVRDGTPLWTSAPSPPGDWQVLLDDGRVLARGVEEGAAVEGEILASGQQAAWTPLGGETAAGTTAAAAGFTSRVGLDGTTMLVTNDAGQLVAYDTATGRDLWSRPLEPGSVRSADLRGGDAVLALDRARSVPLDPREATTVLLLDARTGAEVRDDLSGEVGRVDALGDGRALVTAAGRTTLLAP